MDGLLCESRRTKVQKIWAHSKVKLWPPLRRIFQNPLLGVKGWNKSGVRRLRAQTRPTAAMEERINGVALGSSLTRGGPFGSAEIKSLA